jgi:hypothetical protein
MTQFFGKPQGPLSFGPGSSVSNVAVGLCAVFGIAVGPVDASFTAPDPTASAVVAAPAPAPAPAAATSASSFFCPLEASSVAPSSHAKLTLLTAFQKSSPCCFAIANSVSLG